MIDGKILARLGAVVFVALVITATTVELTRKDESPLYRSVETLTKDRVDPLRAALSRCRDIGEAATRDPECIKTWAVNRERFLRPREVR